MRLSTSASTRCGAAWSSSAASLALTSSAEVPSTRTSYRQDASTTSIRPVPSELVEGLNDVGRRNPGGPAAGALKPLGHAGARRQARGFPSEELRNAQAGLRGAPDQGGIDLVVDVTDLHALRHMRMLSCVYAPSPR